MTFPHDPSPIDRTGTPARSVPRGVALLVSAAFALVLASCGVDSGDGAAPSTDDPPAASTTAAPTTTEATTTTTEDQGPGIGGITGSGDEEDPGDQGGQGDDPGPGGDAGGTEDSTGELTVEEISEEFQNAGLPKDEADCIAEIVHDADLTKQELDEFVANEDGDTPAGEVLTDAITQCFGLGE